MPSIYSSARTELAKLLIYGLFRKIRVLAQDAVTHVQSLRLDAPNYLLPEVTVLPFTARLGIRLSF